MMPEEQLAELRTWLMSGAHEGADGADAYDMIYRVLVKLDELEEPPFKVGDWVGHPSWESRLAMEVVAVLNDGTVICHHDVELSGTKFNIKSAYKHTIVDMPPGRTSQLPQRRRD